MNDGTDPFGLDYAPDEEYNPRNGSDGGFDREQVATVGPSGLIGRSQGGTEKLTFDGWETKLRGAR